MKMSALVLIGSLSLLIVAGCAHNREAASMQRENAELRARVATLETQVAQLKQQQSLAPITIDGLTIKPLEVGELRLAFKPSIPAEREVAGVIGNGHVILSGSNTYTATTTLQKGAGVTIQNLRVAPATTTTTTGTTTTKASSSSTIPSVRAKTAP